MSQSKINAFGEYMPFSSQKMLWDYLIRIFKASYECEQSAKTQLITQGGDINLSSSFRIFSYSYKFFPIKNEEKTSQKKHMYV